MPHIQKGSKNGSDLKSYFLVGEIQAQSNTLKIKHLVKSEKQ